LETVVAFEVESSEIPEIPRAPFSGRQKISVAVSVRFLQFLFQFTPFINAFIHHD
jgi:hypothetical protein